MLTSDSFLSHAQIPFRAADNPFLIEWMHQLRPTYDIPSRFTLSMQMLLAEDARVFVLEKAQLKKNRKLTYLINGWEDEGGWSMYASLGQQRGQAGVLMGLEDMTGKRVDGEELEKVIDRAMGKMDIDMSYFLAITTDNPRVMGKFRRLRIQKAPWILVSIRCHYGLQILLIITYLQGLACFLHHVNTTCGHIVAYSPMKKIITQNAKIISFFSRSHYWGGELRKIALSKKITRGLTTHSDSRWYTLILQALSIQSYRSVWTINDKWMPAYVFNSEPLQELCVREDAQKKVGAYTPVSAEAVRLVFDPKHWNMNAQMIRYCKPLTDAIGNTEARDALLADCTLELLKVAQIYENLPVEEGDDKGFAEHACRTFMDAVHDIITEIHFLALYLHLLCRKLALGQSTYSRTFSDVCRIALGLAERWGWLQAAAAQLVNDFWEYQMAKGVFLGGLADGQLWWENLPVSGMDHPLNSLALDLFCIVAHAAEIERLFSDLLNSQGKKRTCLSEQSMKIIGHLRGNYNQLLCNGGMLKRRKHAHMHTRDGAIIDIDAVESLEEDLGMSEELETSDDHLYALDQLDRAFEALQISRVEEEEGWREERSDEDVRYVDRAQHARA